MFHTSVKIWYLFHSGFAVKTEKHFLVFDYWRDKPKGGGLDSGVIDPAALRDEDVVVFVSHKHGDHYNRCIFKWRDCVPKLRIILSDDVRGIKDTQMIGPGATHTMPDMTVRTLASNDAGVAFVVDVDGLRIYHAGDLNWWHWEGEPDEYNAGMADSYKKEIDLLKGTPLDIAFVPVDPRLGEQYAWGMDYLMRTAEVRYAVPMHFGKDPSVVERLLRDKVTEAYRERIVGFTRCGEMKEWEEAEER